MQQSQRKEENPQPQSPSYNLPKPAGLKAKLDEHVIGQDNAKRALCVAVYNHYKRILSHGMVGMYEDVEIETV